MHFFVNAQVTRHLLKLFDNLADLRFKEDDDGATDPKTTVALGMYSREGEYVPFSQSCVCEGQVRHNDTYTTLHLLMLFFKTFLSVCHVTGRVLAEYSREGHAFHCSPGDL